MPVPPVLPGYVVIGRLGNGSSVWLAEEEASGLRGRARVAVRMGRPEAQEGLLLVEIMSLSRVRSPHVAAFRQCIRTADGACAVVTEYVEGESLAAILAGRPGCRLPWRAPSTAKVEHSGSSSEVSASCVIMGVLRGLAALHGAEPPIVHRRVTPFNILVVRGSAVLTDLRLAALASGPVCLGSGPPVPCGEGVAETGGYMSPELAEGTVGLDGLDARADVWAAGVVLYEALSGERLFPQACTIYTITHVVNTYAVILYAAPLARSCEMHVG